MKTVYPILLSESEGGYLVTVPDWDAVTEGNSLYDAIYMGRDVISLLAVTKEDRGEAIPDASDYDLARKKAIESKAFDEVDYEKSIITYVDVDTDEYRKTLL